MTSKRILNKLSVKDAYKQLEDAAIKLVKKAQWASPYNGFMNKGRRMKSPINELRKPLLELRLAKKM